MTNRVVVGTNFFWRLLERFGAQGITFVVSLVLARILEPEVYGTLALVTVLITVLQVLVDSGLGIALIQKKNADELDFSTVFFFNIFLCSVLYCLLFVLAPVISLIYKNNDLIPVIRTLGILLLISGLKNVQQAFVSRNLLFKKLFFSSLGGTVGSGFIGILLAFNGYGLWALVAQSLLSATISTFILWKTVEWRPQFIFSLQRLKLLFSFGWKLLVSELLNKVWTQLRQLIIGVKYSPEDLAFYNKGHEFPQYATTSINSSIDSVLLPAMSSVQDDKDKVKQMTRRAISISSYVMWPLMMGLAACAEPLIKVLITDKWLFCVPYLRIFCITFAFYPIHTANLNAIKAVGRSDIYLKMEIIKKIIDLVIILCSMWYGVLVMALSTIVMNFCSQIINTWPNKKLLNYSYLDQLRDIMPSLLLSVIMALIMNTVQLLGFNNFVTLGIQAIVGAFIYLSGSAVLKFDSLSYCVSFFKELKKRYC